MTRQLHYLVTYLPVFFTLLPIFLSRRLPFRLPFLFLFLFLLSSRYTYTCDHAPHTQSINPHCVAFPGCFPFSQAFGRQPMAAYSSFMARSFTREDTVNSPVNLHSRYHHSFAMAQLINRRACRSTKYIDTFDATPSRYARINTRHLFRRRQRYSVTIARSEIRQ